MKTIGIILAAGCSERFGQADKLLSQLHGKTLASYAAEAMAKCQIDKRIAVISNPEIIEIFDEFEIVSIDQHNASQSKSIRAGFEQALKFQPDRILITLADMPNITCQILDDVVALCDDEHPSAVTDGQRITPPACFPEKYFGTLKTLKGDVGARHILHKIPAQYRFKLESFHLKDIDHISDLNIP